VLALRGECDPFISTTREELGSTYVQRNERQECRHGAGARASGERSSGNINNDALEPLAGQH